jgi:hypothetical protein
LQYISFTVKVADRLQQGEKQMADVSGVNSVYVVVDDGGNVFHVDGSQGGKIAGGTLQGRGPFSVACSSSHGGQNETCIISDAAGNVWRGKPRGGGFTQI